jgi:hypothetical protein
LKPLQLLFGQLELPIESLRIIEESSSTPAEMQTNLGYVDECGNPASSNAYKDFICSKMHKIKLAPADECVRAAEIYECGKKKAPDVTDAIQRQMTSDLSTAAAVFI